MDLGIKGRLALVTGSTLGIGRAVAETLVSEGARVIVNGRREKTVKETVAALAQGKSDGSDGNEQQQLIVRPGVGGDKQGHADR